VTLTGTNSFPGGKKNCTEIITSKPNAQNTMLLNSSTPLHHAPSLNIQHKRTHTHTKTQTKHNEPTKETGKAPSLT